MEVLVSPWHPTPEMLITALSPVPFTPLAFQLPAHLLSPAFILFKMIQGVEANGSNGFPPTQQAQVEELNVVFGP